MNWIRIAIVILFSIYNSNIISGNELKFGFPEKDSLPEFEISNQRLLELYNAFPKDDPWLQRQDASALSWRESYTLSAFMDLYEATKDIHYLEAVQKRGVQMISYRDDYRNVVDGSGYSRPAWSMGIKYVVAQGSLKDEKGRTVIEFRSTPSSSNNLTVVEVTSFVSWDNFSLKVSNNFHKRYEVFDRISLQPNSDRFISKVVNDPMAPYSSRPGHYTEKSNLVRIESVNFYDDPLPVQSITLQPIPLAFMGYIGVIYHPLVRFAEIVLNDSSLKQFHKTANHFVQSIEESYTDAANRLWRDGPSENEGYYLMCEKGESMPADNVGQPFNYMGKHVAVELAMFRLTGNSEYRLRAEKIANLFKNRLQYDEENNLYVWKYWYEPMTTTGWKPEDDISHNVKFFPGAPRVEDISHGALDLDIVMSAYKMNMIFTEEDVIRFSNTLLKNVILEGYQGVSRGVDGSSEQPRYLNALHRWLILAEVNPQVFTAIKKTYFNVGKENLGFSAHLLKWQNILEE